MSFSISIPKTAKEDVEEVLFEAVKGQPQDQQPGLESLVAGLTAAVENGALGDHVTLTASGHAFVKPDNAGYVNAYASITITESK